ncbi:hypothetical protein F441_05910 [Phytophthora nicotianae CJ01A1]|uniref:Uncharacterized protein n=1 Tax=Phytophthora nicotianae CJ01A1 TaxID=1317063 RepID=W2XCY7_PHYNI|nr:hypothetical protein F441_05910 [Phytophthora nicotianae CJ01A1]
MPGEDREAESELNGQQHVFRRSDLPEQEREAAHELDRQRHADRRAQQTEDNTELNWSGCGQNDSVPVTTRPYFP